MADLRAALVQRDAILAEALGDLNELPGDVLNSRLAQSLRDGTHRNPQYGNLPVAKLSELLRADLTPARPPTDVAMEMPSGDEGEDQEPAQPQIEDVRPDESPRPTETGSPADDGPPVAGIDVVEELSASLEALSRKHAATEKMVQSLATALRLQQSIPLPRPLPVRSRRTLEAAEDFMRSMSGADSQPATPRGRRLLEDDEETELLPEEVWYARIIDGRDEDLTNYFYHHPTHDAACGYYVEEIQVDVDSLAGVPGSRTRTAGNVYIPTIIRPPMFLSNVNPPVWWPIPQGFIFEVHGTRHEIDDLPTWFCQIPLCGHRAKVTELTNDWPTTIQMVIQTAGGDYDVPDTTGRVLANSRLAQDAYPHVGVGDYVWVIPVLRIGNGMRVSIDWLLTNHVAVKAAAEGATWQAVHQSATDVMGELGLNVECIPP